MAKAQGRLGAAGDPSPARTRHSLSRKKQQHSSSTRGSAGPKASDTAGWVWAASSSRGSQLWDLQRRARPPITHGLVCFAFFSPLASSVQSHCSPRVSCPLQIPFPSKHKAKAIQPHMGTPSVRPRAGGGGSSVPPPPASTSGSGPSAAAFGKRGPGFATAAAAREAAQGGGRPGGGLLVPPPGGAGGSVRRAAR